MKQETNNEIDVMLRKLGRTLNTVPANAGKGAPEPTELHLDADELNAYAENSLPKAARARYTEHLAECTRCRQLVSQLSLAAGLVFEEKAATRPATSGVKAFLSSFFSPMVLRYAVPALGLIFVAAIGLFFFRQSATEQRISTETIAQRESARIAPGVVATPANAPRAGTPTEEAAKSKVGEEQQKANKQAKAGEDASPQESGEAKRDESVTATDRIAAARASEPAATVASPKPPVDDEKTIASADVSQRKSQPPTPAPQSAATERPAKELAKASNEVEGAGASAGGFQAAPAKSKSKVMAEESSRKAQPRERDNLQVLDRADKDEAETKSVAGRRFRKEGSIWIDVAYDSSRATVNVTRGSEQYRALVADEPGIKTIADQLGGEVIVVWKNRAYRIR